MDYLLLRESKFPGNNFEPGTEVYYYLYNTICI